MSVLRVALLGIAALIVACDPGTVATCEPTPTLRLGQRCGPCGLDALTCSEGEWVCDGATDCDLGDECASNADCDVGVCTAGRCAPEGMAFIPAGTFIMGSPFEEIGRVEDENQHPTRLTRHFFMDAHEVTQAEWEDTMGYNPAHFSACGPDCPVENISWVDALAFANARSIEDDLPACYDLSHCRRSPGADYRCPLPVYVDLDCIGYRLPTEAEWEYAYRAGSESAFYNGDTDTPNTCDQPLLHEIARFCGNCSTDYGQTFDCSMDGARPGQPTDCGPTEVGSYAPNEWGLHDMSGNVAEMVWDTPGPYARFAQDPLGPDEQTGLAVTRGAGFCGHMARLRAADRKFSDWTTASPVRGVRLVRTYRAAAPSERLGEEICNNGCGGCSVLVPEPGAPCGPCGADTVVCDGENATRCDGATTGCRVGEACGSEADCPYGECSNGRCAPRGMVHVPAAVFSMGSPRSERGRDDDETLHDVVVERPFALGRHEVTQSEWQQMLGTTPSRFSACGPSCPVEMVSRDDALAYSNALSRASSLPECYDLSECVGIPGDGFSCPAGVRFDFDCEGYRLPTEAEWERAYRAGSQTTFYNGSPSDGALCDQPLLLEIAQFCGNCSASYPGTIDCTEFGGFADCGPAPVESHAPNALGLHDMSGNVSELVWDLYGEYPEGIVRDPIGPVDEADLEQVARGGGFCGHMARLRAADRDANSRRARLFDVGFRVARTMPDDGSGPVCDNACGGCRELVNDVGDPCGPCLADRYECDGAEATVCGGSTTTCRFGTRCTRDEDCTAAVCRGGFCTAPGFRYVPPGSFTMGSPPSESLRGDDETLHEVRLTRGLLMMEREVTQGEFRLLMATNPSRFSSCGLDCPVDSVTWLDALAYANALSRAHGLPECYDLSACTGTPGGRFTCPFELTFSLDCRGYRLPTEAEWEYAYRAGTDTTFYAGAPSTPRNCDQPLLLPEAQFCGNCSVEYDDPFDCSATGGFTDCGTTEVMRRAANPWGLHDMNGNVSELVWDVIAPYPASAVDPVGPAHSGQNNIARGGGFCAHYARLRAADRRSLTRIARFPDVGFRLVRTAQP